MFFVHFMLIMCIKNKQLFQIALNLFPSNYEGGGVWVFRGLEIWPKFAGDFGDFEL